MNYLQRKRLTSAINGMSRQMKICIALSVVLAFSGIVILATVLSVSTKNGSSTSDKDYVKLLVAAGDSEKVEIIDLEYSLSSSTSSRTICEDLPDFPKVLGGAVGGLVDGKPVLCGGFRNFNYHKECFILEGKKWNPTHTMNEHRAFAGVSLSPYQNASHKLFVTGGDTHISPTNTAEILTDQGWEIVYPKLPAYINHHCSVLLNSTTVMLIGGRQNGTSSSPKTFLFNSETEEWNEGPSLKTGREGHVCGRVRNFNRSSDEFSVVVAGGREWSLLYSVEILDNGATEWRQGPDLPLGIQYASAIEDSNGGLILIGGDSDDLIDLNTLFRLPHAGEDTEWVELPQTLKYNSFYNTAILVPDDVTNCTTAT